MAITINTTGSVNNKMTTRVRVKSELGISSTDDDSLIDDIIQAASDVIESYTGRNFAKVDLTETLPGNGSAKLLVSRRPIASVTEVQFDGSTISSTEYSIENAAAGVLFKETFWTDTQIQRSFIEPMKSGYGRRDWSVEYTGGYTCPSTSSTAASDLPGNLELACLSIAKLWYLEKDDNPNVYSQRTGDAQETKYYRTNDLGIPPLAKALLSSWREVHMPDN